MSILVDRLDEDFPIAPGGRVLTVETADARAPLRLDTALESFLPNLLTPRERSIVMRVLLGGSSLDIAEELGVSEGTIKNHRKRLYKKLGIVSERDLFARFLEHLSASEP